MKMAQRGLTRALSVLAVLIACAALVLSSSATGRATAGKTCMPVSIEDRMGTFTYTVRVEAGSVGCGLARAVVRDAADWPPDADEESVAARWHCSVGQGPSSWAISCARGGAIVRAYGPVRERNPWVIAQVRLRIGLMAPTHSVGLALRSIRLRPCGGLRKWLTAEYRRADGATLTIAEGRPHTCANLGVSPQLAVWRIHGSPAHLAEFCAPTGCARLTGEYALDWREGGIEFTLLTHRLRQQELVTIARSMTVVAA
jgi:hypothetical protein